MCDQARDLREGDDKRASRVNQWKCRSFDLSAWGDTIINKSCLDDSITELLPFHIQLTHIVCHIELNILLDWHFLWTVQGQAAVEALVDGVPRFGGFQVLVCLLICFRAS